MPESKPKNPGQKAVTVGWILNGIAGLLLLGMWYGPHTRDPSIEALLRAPSVAALAGTVGLLIGSNILTLLPFILGLYARARHKNSAGANVMICALVIFLGVTIRQFMPSGNSEERRSVAHHQSFPASHEQCEFTVVFPHATKTREATVAGLRSHMVESEGDVTPHLRVEFMPLPNASDVADVFAETLRNFARMAGLSIPEITVENSTIGKKGTYSGIKTVGENELRLHGITVLGDRSMIHCMIVEPLSVFPSEDAVRFMESIRRR